MIKSQVSSGERANIKCEFKKEGLVCPQIATVDLYGKEISGFFCLRHADEIIELFKDSDPIENLSI